MAHHPDLGFCFCLHLQQSWSDFLIASERRVKFDVYLSQIVASDASQSAIHIAKLKDKAVRTFCTLDALSTYDSVNALLVILSILGSLISFACSLSLVDFDLWSSCRIYAISVSECCDLQIKAFRCSSDDLSRLADRHVCRQEGRLGFHRVLWLFRHGCDAVTSLCLHEKRDLEVIASWI